MRIRSNQRREQRRRNRRQPNYQRPSRRRERRSSPDSEPNSRLMLECAGCPMDPPFSSLASKTTHRWLIMAKRMNTTSQMNSGAPSLKVRSNSRCLRSNAIQICDTVGEIRPIFIAFFHAKVPSIASCRATILSSIGFKWCSY